ncbi:MAG: L,D-transpeptidase [Candidatus Kerfeldbacteria bacterium]|nr:L,D-transpeptidase [Candidatus Kerfeldbacteria bacterium]
MINQYWLMTIGGSLALMMFISVRPIQAAELDSDNDGLSDEAEVNVYHTDPFKADTDDDGYKDGDEVTHGFSPRHSGGLPLAQVDSDKDYLPDAWELALGTDLMNPDTDGDKYLDGTEVRAGYDPLNTESKKLAKDIKIDLKTQRLAYYLDGKKLEEFPISSGVKRLPTPTGEFSVLHKIPAVHYKGPGFDYPNTKWNLHFATNGYRYYIHGAYWHNDFGKPKSHGCVNVSYQNMERLYNWAQVGTPIKISA